MALEDVGMVLQECFDRQPLAGQVQNRTTDPIPPAVGPGRGPNAQAFYLAAPHMQGMAGRSGTGENRTCRDVCRQFAATRPPNGRRYESGQARCQICDIWVDYRGAHTKDGSPAEKDSVGWHCNCCNYRLRMNPRNRKYKEKLRTGSY